MGRRKSEGPQQIDIGPILTEPLTVKKDGAATKMSAFEVGLRNLVRKASKGDLKAAIKFIELCESCEVIKPAEIANAVTPVGLGILLSADWSRVEFPDDDPQL